MIAFYDWSAAPFLVLISFRGFSRSLRALFCHPSTSLPRLIIYAHCFGFQCLSPKSSTSLVRAPTVHPTTVPLPSTESSGTAASWLVKGSCCAVGYGNRQNSEFLVKFTKGFFSPDLKLTASNFEFGCKLTTSTSYQTVWDQLQHQNFPVTDLNLVNCFVGGCRLRWVLGPDLAILYTGRLG